MYPYKKIEAARSYFRAGQLLQWLMLAALAFSAFAHFSHAQSAAQSNAPQPLAAGVPITRELSGGQTHSYQVTLTQGQYLEAVVEQRGIDVVVTVFAPDGQKIVKVDSPIGTQGPERVMLVAETSGPYRLEVRSYDQIAKAGNYEAKLVELHQAAQRDRDRIAAEIAAMAVLRAGQKLLAQMTKESIEAAVRKFEEAQQLFQAAGNKWEEANTLNLIGNQLLSLGQLEQGRVKFTQSLALFRSLGDRNEEARTLNNLGAVYSLTGDQQKAMDYFKESLPLLRAVGNRETEADTLNNIGHVYQGLSESQQALDYFNQALSLYRMLDNRNGEAVALNALGVVNRSSGEFQKALDYFSQALKLWRELGTREREAVTLHGLGNMSMTLGENQQALDFFNQALSIFRSVGDPVGEAKTLSAIGAAWSSAGDQQKSLESYNQALLLQRKAGDRAGEADTLAKLGAAYHGAGEMQKAMDYYQQGLSLMRVVGDREKETGTLINIGLAYEKSDQKPRASEYFQQAFALARAIQMPEREASALFHQSRTNDALGNLAEARQQLEESLRIFESLRGKLSAQELRASYFASVQGSYDLYIDLLMRMDQQAGRKSGLAALEASERARARSLLELLAEAHADIRQGADPSLLAKEQAFQRKLNAKAEAQTKLLSGKYTEAQATAIAKEIADLAAQHRELQSQIRTSSPRYAALTQPQPLTAPEIQRLLDDDTLLLEYALGERASYLWLVSPTSINSYQLPPRAEIEQAARKVYDLLIARQPQPGLNEAQQFERVKKAESEYPAQAAVLSRMLLAPVTAEIGHKRLVIVAAGMLEYLPFAALPEPTAEGNDSAQATPLLANHEVINLPSASVLAVLRRERATRATAVKSVAVLADPVFTADDPRVGALSKAGKGAGAPASLLASRTQAPPSQQAPPDQQGLTRAVRDFNFAEARGGLVRLPFSREEADAILSFAPRGAGLKALSFEASHAMATGPELGQYRIVHFATHGLLNSEHPELSGLVLSLVDASGKSQDGFLRLHEIYNLKLNADLVVLSACQTGLGKQIKGEGLVGLTRGFMYAGAPRVVASLWQVNDLATAELMKRFYRGMLKDGQRPVAALRTAQLEMMKQQRWASPYFWAAFVLQGEWR